MLNPCLLNLQDQFEYWELMTGHFAKELIMGLF